MKDNRSEISPVATGWIIIGCIAIYIFTLEGKAFPMSDDVFFLEKGDHRFTGVFPESDFWFYIPETWEIREGTRLYIKFKHSTILLPDWSSFTVLVNDKAIKSVRLSHPDLLWHTEEMNISKDILHSGWNVVQFRFYQRSVKDPCTEIDNPGLWTMLSQESKFRVIFALKEAEPDLSLFPLSYIIPTRTKDEPPRVIFYFPEKSTSSHLQTAAILSARFGQTKEVKEDSLWAVRIGKDEPPPERYVKRSNLIFIGTVDEYPSLSAAGFPDSFVRSIREKADSIVEKYSYIPSLGFVIEAKSPFNRYKRVLILSGRDEMGLLLAGSNISKKKVTAQFSGDFQVFAEHPPATIEEYLDEAKVTFSSLNLNDLVVRGIFTKTVNFSLKIPGNWKLTKDSYIFLYLSHSILLKKSSIFELSLNQTPIFSLELTPTIPGEDISLKNIKIPIPENQLNNREFEVELRFFLDIGSEDCSRPYDESAWAVVRNDSYFYFAHEYKKRADLSYYPDIFIKNQSINDLYYILSEEACGAEIKVMLMSSALMGYNLSKQEEVYPKVLNYSSFTHLDKIGKDFIMIGIPSENETLISYEKELPVMLDKEGRISSVSKKVYHLPEFGHDMGLLEIRVSPWDWTRYQLFAMAIAKDGMEKVNPLLSQVWDPSVLSGDVTFILDKNKTLNYVTTEEEKEPEKVGKEEVKVQEEVTKKGEWIKYPIIIIIILGIVAVILYTLLKSPRTKG